MTQTSVIWFDGVSIQLPEPSATMHFMDIANRIESGAFSRLEISDQDGTGRALLLITPTSTVSLISG